MILVDTNVLIDIVSEDPTWADWSEWSLGHLHSHRECIANAIVYAEFAVRFSSQAQCDLFFDGFDLGMPVIDRTVAFEASRAFDRYRARGGKRTQVLADFFIGAHARVLPASVLTRDPRHFRTYFPELDLITPDTLPLPPSFRPYIP